MKSYIPNSQEIEIMDNFLINNNLNVVITAEQKLFLLCTMTPTKTKIKYVINCHNQNRLQKYINMNVFSEEQLREILFGLEANVDVDLFAKPEIEWYYMENKRYELMGI